MSIRELRNGRKINEAFANINIFSLIKQDGEGWMKQKQQQQICGIQKKKTFIQVFFLLLLSNATAESERGEKNIILVYAGANIKTQHEY